MQDHSQCLGLCMCVEMLQLGVSMCLLNFKKLLWSTVSMYYKNLILEACIKNYIPVCCLGGPGCRLDCRNKN